MRIWKPFAKKESLSPARETGKKPQLRVFMPRLCGGTFSDLQREAARAVLQAKKTADKEKSDAPGIMLFSEICLKYRFTAGPEESQEQLEIMRAMMRKESGGLWLAAAFCVMENYGIDDSRSTGYLLPQDGQAQKYHKRLLTYGDTEHMDSIFFGSNRAKWRERRDGLKDEPFPWLVTPLGMKVEYRICADVCSMPLESEPQTVSVLSSNGNQVGYLLSGIGPLRRMVIENDANRKMPATYAKERQEHRTDVIGPGMSLFTLFE
jgi:hypothetical protein